MPLPITYATVANTVNGWCNNNCINLGSKWDSCPAWCKSGWSSSNILFAGNNEAAKGSIYRYNLTNGVTQHAALNTSNTQSSCDGFGVFLKNRGATLANNVPKSEWIEIARGILEWCAVSVKLMGNFKTERGTTNPTVYFVWVSETGPTIDYSSTIDRKEVIATDINTMIANVLTLFSSTSRCISAQYTITLASN